MSVRADLIKGAKRAQHRTRGPVLADRASKAPTEWPSAGRSPGDRFEGTWEPSNTRTQLTKVSDRNQATGGRFVHHVREAKELTKQHEDLGFVSGIVVESLAYAVIGRELPDKVAIALFLDHAKDAIRVRFLSRAERMTSPRSGPTRSGTPLPGCTGGRPARRPRRWHSSVPVTWTLLRYRCSGTRASDPLAERRPGAPKGALRVLRDLFGVAVDRVLEPRYGGAVLDMSFTPLPELAAAGYEGERARVNIRPDGRIYSLPLGPDRTWHHRYPSPLGVQLGMWPASSACGTPRVHGGCGGSGRTDSSSTSPASTGTCSTRSSTAARASGPSRTLRTMTPSRTRTPSAAPSCERRSADGHVDGPLAHRRLHRVCGVK